MVDSGIILSCGRTLEYAPEPAKDGPEVVAHAYVVDGEAVDWGWGDKPLLPKDPSLVRLIRLSDYEYWRSVVTPKMIEAGAKAFLKVWGEPSYAWFDYREEIRAALEAALEAAPNGAHDLYKTGDPDAPDVIKDRNGEVVLGLCRMCGKAEVELSEPCTGERP